MNSKCVWLALMIFSSCLAYGYGPPKLPGSTSPEITTPRDARRYEDKLLQDPGDAVSHYLLMEYYLKDRCKYKWARQGYQRHVLWFIKNRPASHYHPLHPVEDQQAYQQAKELWLEYSRESEDTKVLLRAASFFSFFEPIQAETIYQKLEKKDAKDRLGLFGMRKMYWTAFRNDGDKRYAAGALAVGEEVCKRFKKKKRWFLANMAEAAYELGDYDKANKFAKECLKTAKKNEKADGMLMHYGNIIQARLALRQGDIKKAKDYLKKSIDLPGDLKGITWMEVTGPDLMIVKELLAVGEKELVLEYLSVCEKCWPQEKDLIRYCIDVLNRGMNPPFNNPRIRWRSGYRLSFGCSE